MPDENGNVLFQKLLKTSGNETWEEKKTESENLGLKPKDLENNYKFKQTFLRNEE